MSLPKKNTVNVVSCLRYHDSAAAVDWLCRAFGFERHLVVPGEKEGSVGHAELRFGNGLVMLGPAGVNAGAFDEVMTTPREIGGRNTQCAYLIVDDPAAHYQQAVSAGAKIVTPLEKKGYGGSGYTLLDLEGNVWSFGDYDPLAG